MKIRHLFVAALLLGTGQAMAQQPLYKQANAPIEERIKDLMERMTVEEKVGQLCCPMGWEMYTKTGNKVEASELYKKQMGNGMPIGSYWAVLRADPWTQKTLENGLNPELAAEALNKLQKFAVEETRLGIPVLFAEETPHGHMAIGATVFPTGLSMASTWNPELLRRAGEIVALEARLQGANVGYGPVLDISREPRWSRMEESFGEDPMLAGILGVAYMKGMQGDVQNDGKHLYSTVKHFAAYGTPEGGHNGDRAMVGMNQLFSDFLPPMKMAVENGLATIMTSYNAIDGVPCTSNKFLLTDILRGKWGFNGFVYSDLFSIDGIAGTHHVAADVKEAGKLSLEAGVDMDLGANAYGKRTLELLNEGRLDMKYVDAAVANILRLKFKMGLFENPYVSPKDAKNYVRSEAHRQVAREVAREGIVLLKNDGILPLSKDVKSIAVIGPNADTQYNQLGDYTAPQDDKFITTPLEGIQAAVSKKTEVKYVKGCAIRDVTMSDIPGAVKAAKESDVVVLVVGGSSARDFRVKYEATAAAIANDEEGQILLDMDCGEGYDRSTLDLLGDQEKLMEALIETGKPLVVVYIQGRTLKMNLAAEKANALLTAWYPGGEGGHAIADVLFGDYNPAGRLPVSIARNEGQLPIYYSKGKQRAYMDGEANALYAFGYGLSYTKFEYSDLQIKPGNGKDVLQTVTCTVKNTGDRDGQEIVQLYIRDMVASIAQAPILLKAFERVELKKGESKTVTFNLGKRELSMYNAQLEEVVEPGDFKVMIGAASDDIRLEGKFTL